MTPPTNAAPTAMPPQAPCWVGFSFLEVDLALSVLGHQSDVMGADELRGMQFKQGGIDRADARIGAKV
jgi:hypothetical protein